MNKGKFRKDYLDIVAILPQTEGKVELGKDVYTTLSVPIGMVTDVEKMNAVFRQIWVNLAKHDKTLSKLFEEYFKNQELEKKRIEKLLQKTQTKVDPNDPKRKKLEKKLKAFEKKKK